MATIGRLDLKVAVDSATFVRETQRINSSVNAMGGNVARQSALMERSFAGVTRGVGLLKTGLASLGIGLGVAFFSRAITGALDTADALAKTSRQVGVTVEQLQGLQRGSELAGVGVQGLNTNLERFAKRLGEADRGTGELRKVIDANNIVLREANGQFRSTNDLLEDFADLIAAAGSPQEKLALATAAFGREGAKMVELLKNGSVGLREMQAELLKSTHTTQEQAEAAERANDAMTRWAAAIRSNFVSAVGEALLAIEDLVAHMKELEVFGGTGGGFTAAQRMFELSAEIADAAAEAAAATGDAKRIAEARLATLRMEGAAIADEIAAMQALERQEKALLRAVPPTTDALAAQAEEIEAASASTTKASKAVQELTAQQQRLAQAGAFLKTTSAGEQRYDQRAETADRAIAEMQKFAREQDRIGEGILREQELQAARQADLMMQPLETPRCALPVPFQALAEEILAP